MRKNPIIGYLSRDSGQEEGSIIPNDCPMISMVATLGHISLKVVWPNPEWGHIGEFVSFMLSDRSPRVLSFF